MTNFLSRDNMNINLAMTGDVEDAEYRYQIFSGYRSWVAEVFRAYPGPRYSPNWEVRVRIFSEAKDKAIALIMAVREEAANKVSNSVTNYEEAALALLALSKKQKAENEALRAQLAELQTNNQQVVNKLKYEKEEHAKTKYELNRVENKLQKAERKVSIMMGIKVAQAAYMQIAHGVIQKVRG